MKVSVHYYAAARELAGCDRSSVELDSDSVSQAQFRTELSRVYPGLAGYLDRMRLAVNGDFVDAERAIRDGDRVDVLPPVAGGAPVVHCRISEEPILLDPVWQQVRHPGAGGVAFFVGVVRDHADGKRVVRLDYEAHESLAEKEMRDVLRGVAERHPGVRLAAVHRVGPLEVGDIAVCVAASAAHRAEAFSACREAIDRIKETVPVWKKEWGPDGEALWVNLSE
jgi:molybdopterin synthase catalytic subunit/molybdopterin converting factor small subunit